MSAETSPPGQFPDPTVTYPTNRSRPAGGELSGDRLQLIRLGAQHLVTSVLRRGVRLRRGGRGGRVGVDGMDGSIDGIDGRDETAVAGGADGVKLVV